MLLAHLWKEESVLSFNLQYTKMNKNKVKRLPVLCTENVPLVNFYGVFSFTVKVNLKTEPVD